MTPAARRDAVAGSAAAGLARLVTRRAALCGFAVTRIGFGAVLLVLLLVNAPGAGRLWAPDAPFGLDLARAYVGEAGSFSLYVLSAAPAWTTALLVLTGAAALAFCLGWRTRVVTPLLAVLVFSLQERNPYVTDGGDNLLRILLVYLVLADCGARWSLDARRRAGRPADPGSTRWQLGTLLHNAAFGLVVFQVCVVYATAGLAKVRGPFWQDGTAVYYVLRDAQFSTWPALSRLLVASSLVVNLVTWGTVLLQVAFPFLLLRRTSRHLALAAAAGMHVGIGLLMGLPLFSATMILSEAVLVSDRGWERAAALLRRRAPTPAPAPTHTPAPALAPVPVEAPG